MDQISDIESIILSQSWKQKSKSYQNSPLQRSPVRVPINFNSKQGYSNNSSQNSSQNSVEDKTHIEIHAEVQQSEDEKERLAELAKLAVPYHALNDALTKMVSKKVDSPMIPTFPMRNFGKVKETEVDPKFEYLKPDICSVTSRKTHVEYIKKKGGRTTSIKPTKLPPLYSPRHSKQ